MKKKFLKIFAFSISLIVLYFLSQFALYHYEGGLRVADKYNSEKPLSENYLHIGEPLTGRGWQRRYNWFDNWPYWQAFRKFPTLQHCLTKEGQATMDVEKFNWKSMRTKTQLKVCLHHTGTYF